MSTRRLMVAAIISMTLGVSARAQAAGTEIITIIAPVRIVVVDRAGHILTVDSNTPTAIVPQFRLGSEAGSIIPPSPKLMKAYDHTLDHLNLHRYGIIYRASGQNLSLDLFRSKLKPLR